MKMIPINDCTLEHFFTPALTFKPSVLHLLKRDLEQFHGLFRGPKSSCKGVYLEELIYRALIGDGSWERYVKWDQNSHSPMADITIIGDDDDYPFSIKSGKREGSRLKLSGFRLTRFSLNIAEMNSYLKEHPQIMTIAAEGKRFISDWIYTIRYLPNNLFSYPDDPNEWVLKRKKQGDKQGEPASYNYTMKNGIRCVINIDTSWQLWWSIPVTLIEEIDIIEIK